MKLILKNVRKIYVCDDEFNILENSSIYIENGKIKKIGKIKEEEEIEVFDASDYISLPGFIDSHTHLIYAGDRLEEFKLKLQGISYLEILKKGGGILKTVNDTKMASDEEIENLILERLNILIKEGTTTCEIKTGYGLSLKDEERLLRILNKIKEKSIQDIVITYMGAHAIPEGYSKNKYVEEIINEGIPMAKKYAEFCDVFCEKGVFTYSQSKRICEKAKEFGLLPKIHADEISDSKGAYLAGEIGAVSCEHMVHSSIRGIKKMKEKNVIAVLLPATSFFLRKKFADAKKIKNEGVKIAIATDHNPGTSPCFSLLTPAKLALFIMKMEIKDVILGITLNAARAIKREKILGSIEEGKQADIILFKIPDIHYLFYNFDYNFKKVIIKKGKIIYKYT
ncbi:MAG: imidazolonepropionase [candidate division WOR-3 bacterium]